MSISLTPPETPAAEPAVPSPSLLARTGRVFVRPMRAWEGLETHVTWWFPLIVSIVIAVVLLLVTYDRVMMPTITQQWDKAIENGQMTAAQVDKMSEFMSGPAGKGIIVGQQAVAYLLMTLLMALALWFGVGFVLGTRFSYRQSLEVVAWAGLVRLPEVILTFVIGWSQESLKGIHFGLGVLLPASDSPSKLMAGLAVLLDAFSPFVAWYVFVCVVGCAALTGAPRKNVAWVLVGLYLAISLLLAGVTAAFAPGA